jgi:hypothetical protein
VLEHPEIGALDLGGAVTTGAPGATPGAVNSTANGTAPGPSL